MSAAIEQFLEYMNEAMKSLIETQELRHAEFQSN
jgi:hypothetical protein